MAAVGNPQYNPWSAPAQPSETPLDEVRTIFVLGFPPDVKERELQNLLRWWPGFEASQMNFKGDQPMGFALFSNASMAMAARDALQNLVFDAEAKSVLRAEMAKKNLYVKRGVAGMNNEPPYDHSKRMRTGGDCAPSPYHPPAAFVSPAPPAWPPQGYMQPAPYDPYGAAGYPVAPVPPPVAPPAPVTPAGYAPVQNTKDNPPCNTLFIGNLGEATSEAELRALFSSQPGFRQMKVLRQGRSTVCFIEFVDVTTAMTVHTNLQGAVISTSDRGGMRIQYSKNPYGRKKEPSAPPLDGSAPTIASPTSVNGTTHAERRSATPEKPSTV